MPAQCGWPGLPRSSIPKFYDCVKKIKKKKKQRLDYKD
jgi:hypothetical protein